jgi:ABC-type transport system substrate-binding protein
MPPRSASIGRSLTAAGVLVLVAACTAAPGPGPRPPPDRPSPSGTIRLAYPSIPPTLDPVDELSPAAIDILRAVLPSFYLVTPDLAYRPYLLEGEPEVRTRGERMTVRFRIRADARWSDGTPITVTDVAYTADVMQEAPPVRRGEFDHLREVVEESPTVGRLELSPPLEDWRGLFSAGRFVLPAHTPPDEAGGWDLGPPVAGGPFTLGEMVRGRSVTLERNPRFFGPSPLAQRIEVAFVPDPTTAIQLLREGLVDVVAPMLGVSWGRRLADVPGAEAGGSLGHHLVHLVMNGVRLPGVGDRRSVADAVDRGRFVDAVLRSQGVPAEGVVAPEVPGSVPAWARYGRGRPEPGGIDGELSMVYVRGELLDLTARYLQAELRQVGVDLELVPLESDVFWGMFLPEGRFDLAIVEARGGPIADLGSWAAVSSAGVDRTLRRLVDEAAEGDRTALASAQRRLAALALVLPLYQPRAAMGWLEGVTGIQPNPSVDGPLWNAWAWGQE